MTDVEVLKLYRECHMMAQDLGLVLDIKDDHFKVYKDGSEITARMKLTTLSAYLEGYGHGKR